VSLPRKDLKFYLDSDVHAALHAIAEVKGVTMQEWVESVVEPVVRTTVSEVTLLHAAFLRSGIARDRQG
jgi:hypothetical protein